MIATIKITVAFIITVTMVKIIITMIVVKISPPAWTAWSRARIRETSVEFEGKSLRRRTWHLREMGYYYIASEEGGGILLYCHDKSMSLHPRRELGYYHNAILKAYHYI